MSYDVNRPAIFRQLGGSVDRIFRGAKPMVSEKLVREAWLRAEALCECRKGAHGHAGRCNQFLIWAERGGAGRGAWEACHRDDPRKPPCEILCVACYTKAMGRNPTGNDTPAG